jgi:YidC/Oxa1 family membrane protein insertase
MERNLLLALVLSVAVLWTWTLLFEPPPSTQPVPEVPPAEAPEGTGALPDLEPAEAAAPEPAPAVGEGSAESVASRQIAIETPLYMAVVDTRGASLAHWELKGFRAARREGGAPVVLTTGSPPFDRALATPFTELGGGDLTEAVFEVEREAPHELVLRHTRNGVSVRKTFAFREDEYLVDLRIEVENGSEQPIGPRFAVNWPASERPGNDFREQSLAVLHDGSVTREMLSGFGKPGFFGGEPDRELAFAEGPIDWAGSVTNYFAGAVLPDQPAQARARFVAAAPAHTGVAQIYFDPLQLSAGRSAERVFRVFIGPKEPERLEALGAGLIHAIDFGWSWVEPLTRFFGWLLQALHVFVPNYGVAIILLTILVRAVTAPLTNRQMRSMERMRKLSPKLQELREKYADDRQKQSEEMMALYRREGVNPLGGCLPMVLQLPVFIGLFYALRSSIQLRQAPFFGWIDDLSAPDVLAEIPGIGIPIRVLPLVMGATMLVQQKITPMQQMDPAQQKMMTIVMPIVMTVVFYQFPSGLVLYWMVSNVLAIAHQLWIGRSIRA